jgi:hypothetical protein
MKDIFLSQLFFFFPKKIISTFDFKINQFPWYINCIQLTINHLKQTTDETRYWHFRQKPQKDY